MPEGKLILGDTSTEQQRRPPRCGLAAVAFVFALGAIAGTGAGLAIWLTARQSVLTPSPEPSASSPRFATTLVDDRIPSGRTLSYWVQDIDINGDGRPDLLTYGCCSAADRLEYWQNLGDGNWSASPTILATLPYVVAAYPGDIDGDGDVDF
eukprot:6874489-Prymnesium_polylepis.1